MSKNTYKNLITSINDLNSREELSIYVPSAGGEQPFSPLTVKQQKQLLASGVDTDFENLSFMNTINDIIVENCKTDITLLTSDKPLIVLQLRQHAIGNILKIIHDDTEYMINLQEHVNRCKSIDGTQSIDMHVSHDVINLTCRTPDLKTDTAYNKQFTKKVQKESGKNGLRITDIIGEIYVSELVKYIESIAVGDDVIRPLVDIDVSSVIDIFEKLPIQVSNKLSKLVADARKFETECLSHESLPDDVSITIDASLFTAE